LLGFDSLLQADQVALIKASTVDASFLRSAYSFAKNPEVTYKFLLFCYELTSETDEANKQDNRVIEKRSN
jgi:hypothetical protein